jgi:hypothetical protein
MDEYAMDVFGWANAFRISDVLLGRGRLSLQDEASPIIPQISGNTILCGGPVEAYSLEKPIWHPKTPKRKGCVPST